MGSSWGYILRSPYATKSNTSHSGAEIDTIQFEIGKHYRLDKLRWVLLIKGLALTLGQGFNVSNSLLLK